MDYDYHLGSNKNMEVTDLLLVHDLGIEEERGYMNFQNQYLLVLKCKDIIGYTCMRFWWRKNAYRSVEDCVREVLSNKQPITVEQLSKYQARYTTFD